MTTAIDKLIAEKVMGWVPAIVNGKPGWFDGDNISHTTWSPSTCIEHAFEALEHWRLNDELWWYQIFSAKHWGLGFQIDLRVGSFEPEICKGRADTLPLAICIALLRAFGVREQEIEEARKG